MQAKITVERLRELLDYHPDSGIFRWRVTSHGMPFGSRAGTVLLPYGSRRIRIDGRLYAEHRLAWLYMTGKWPEKVIDHRNGNNADNRFSNLREATPQQNSSNIRRSAKNKWGFRGVKKCHGRPGFLAVIRHNKKRYWFGPFPTPEEAHAAYVDADLRFRGEFAALAPIPEIISEETPPPLVEERNELTQERLREVVSYNPDDGIFTWLVNGHQKKSLNRKGTAAGKVDATGYLRIFFDGWNYKAHRLVWLYLYGRWPVGVDHINGDRLDNSLSNLREATSRENTCNRKGWRNHLPMGVHRCGSRWRATIAPNGKWIHLGVFDTIEEASAAYQAAAREHFGEFARAG